MKLKITIPDNVLAIMENLEKNGYSAYIIGGAVRDFLMDKEPKDFDIFTNANSDNIFKLYPNGKVIGNKERQEKVLTVIVNGVEVSTFRKSGDRKITGKTLKEHLSTCDFTINAMAIDYDKEFYDFHDGAKDLVGKVLRCVGCPGDRIYEDPNRVMRAVRIAILNKMEIEEELGNIIRNYDYNNIPIENITKEFLRTLENEDAFTRMYDFGVLNKIMPEFERIIVMDGGSYHNETVGVHCNKAFQLSCGLTDNIMLRFACAMHDIGKGPAMKIREGKITFYDHARIGEKMVKQIMERMKFPKKDIEYVCALVGSHMYGYGKYHTNKSYSKVFNMFEERGVKVEDAVLLNYCDSQANMKTTRKKFHEYLVNSKFIKKYYELKSENHPFKVKDLEISGEDVMSVGVPAGKEIGEVLNSLFDLVQDGKLENKRHSLMLYLRYYYG